MIVGPVFFGFGVDSMKNELTGKQRWAGRGIDIAGGR